MVRQARDVMLDILRDEGVTHIFGNPGSTEMPLMDALVDATDIRYVLGLQEATSLPLRGLTAIATMPLPPRPVRRYSNDDERLP